MSLIYVGAILREHGEESYRDFGQVVHVSSDLKAYWWIPLPERQPIKSNLDCEFNQSQGRLRAFIKKPKPADVQEAKNLGEKNLLSTIRFEPPEEWYLTDIELSDYQTNRSALKNTRRNYPNWLNVRNKAWDLILPIVKFAADNNRSLGSLLEDDSLYEQVRRRAQSAEAHNQTEIEQVLFRYLLGNCDKNALLPRLTNCGNPGKKKLSSVKTGRPNIEAAQDIENRTLRGYVCSDVDRTKLQRGWKRYMVKNSSLYRAYLNTMKEFYAVSVKYISSSEVDVELLPPDQRPTFAEFRRHGPNDNAESLPWRIQLGEINYQQNHRPLKGTARDGIVAIGQIGWIDSTPEDQNLVSAASRLKPLPTSHRTIIVEGLTGYIIGLYAGLEPSSTMTGLLALLHAASSKVEWCARYGITIQESDWLSFTPRYLRGDNGDLKSEEGIAVLQASEVGLEVVRAWWASHKGPVEGSHKSLHRKADHLSAGTSHGRQYTRTEMRPQDDACLTFAEKMPSLIRAVLKRNNEEIVPELLTIEMRNDNVVPTRKNIFEWYIKNGYVVSEPTNLDLLRARCLPKFRARVDGSSVKIYDPRYPDNTHLIHGLSYWSKWLHESGLTAKGRKRVQECEVSLDPTYPSIAWLNLNGTHKLKLRTSDPLMREVTLCDWISICDDDSLVKFLDRGTQHNSDASHFASADATNDAAREAKRSELNSQNKGSKSKASQGEKRVNRAEEINQQKRERIGIDSLPPRREEYATVVALDIDFHDPDDDPLMKLVRERRTV